jgi:hypothetical protein
MNEVNWLKAAAGSPEVPEEIDVTSEVMRTLRGRRAPQPTTMPMWFGIALASWGLAIASIVVAQQAVSAWQDPLVLLLRF